MTDPRIPKVAAAVANWAFDQIEADPHRGRDVALLVSNRSLQIAEAALAALRPMRVTSASGIPLARRRT